MLKRLAWWIDSVFGSVFFAILLTFAALSFLLL